MQKISVYIASLSQPLTNRESVSECVSTSMFWSTTYTHHRPKVAHILTMKKRVYLRKLSNEHKMHRRNIEGDAVRDL